MAGKVSVIVVGGKDRQVETRLRTAGLNVSSQRAEALSELAHPSSTPPDVVVLDLRGGGALPAGLAPLKRHHPDTTVIMVTDVLDARLVLDAMRGGVSECITDLDGGDLEAAIARLVAERAAPEAGDVFAFVGAKGGVGNTTVAVNVATVLAKRGSTLIVDLLPSGGDAALFFAVSPRFSVNDTLENTHRLDAAFFRGLVTRTSVGPDVLASAERPGPMLPESTRIRAVVDFAARHYRFTILDISRFDSAPLDALESATGIVVVTTQELPSVRSASRLVADLRGRYGKDKVSVIIGRTDRDAEIAVEDVQRAISGSVLTALPNDYRAALEALNRGKPLVVGGQGALAGALQACANQLARLDAAAAPPRASFLGRLSGRK